MQTKWKTEVFFFSIYVFLTTFTYTTSQNEDDCTCVTYYLCSKTDGNVIRDGTGLIDERSGLSCTCNSPCPQNEKCCHLKNHETNSTTQLSATKPKCGVSNPDGVAFKIGSGENTQFGEFPWMVGILDESGGYRCGGSLIHPSVVLTAAHCVVRKKTYIVRAGEWDSSNTQEILKHKDLPVASIKIHEDYYPPVHHNDIALLFINGSFSLEPHINTVCLPTLNTALDGKRCYVSGWGKDRFGVGGQYPAVLKKVDLPLVERNTCQENLRETKVGKHFNLHRSSLCAGGEKDKDACIGDGGGPLVCPIPGEENRYYQIGIVSWGVECNRENVPGVYGNVQTFREWIDQQMTNKNFAKSYFQY